MASAEQYERLGQWAHQELTTLHTAHLRTREEILQLGQRHDAAAHDIQTLFARMWSVEQRLEAAEGRLATVAAEVTQMAATVKQVAEVAQSAKTQARTDRSKAPPQAQTPF